jgi:hypothetical protein
MGIMGNVVHAPFLGIAQNKITRLTFTTQINFKSINGLFKQEETPTTRKLEE